MFSLAFITVFSISKISFSSIEPVVSFISSINFPPICQTSSDKYIIIEIPFYFKIALFVLFSSRYFFRYNSTQTSQCVKGVKKIFKKHSWVLANLYHYFKTILLSSTFFLIFKKPLLSYHQNHSHSTQNTYHHIFYYYLFGM